LLIYLFIYFMWSLVGRIKEDIESKRPCPTYIPSSTQERDGP
jgi:hypothetical protein